MAKKNRKKKNGAFVISENSKARVFVSGIIKDDYCNYSYDIMHGIGAGNNGSFKGKGIIDPDMIEAFRMLNVHMAIIDDAFANSKVEIDNVDKFHNHELTARYNVTGFKIVGGTENESIILIGTKWVTLAGGRIALETPKIPLDQMASYTWYNELKEASDKVRLEVELYDGGKYTKPEEESAADQNQLTIGDAIEDASKSDIEVKISITKSGDEDDKSFEKAKM